MNVLFQSDRPCRPDLSIVLTDWSCRESFHILEYLSRQTLPRDRYEVLWVEYHARRPDELARRQDRAGPGAAPAVDVHAVLEVPADVYYHKHLMYNAGIVLARGRIVCICDSDAIVSPTFAESVLRAFDAEGDVVLHLDQVRNLSRRFYPFDFPSFERIVGPGCVNWVNGKPAGLWDEQDPLHTRNYGACMAARRQDLIAIGGADESVDYLGHICGPYEMTFRLVNAGKRVSWHPQEWLYHVWHPGEAGEGNLGGPHDGRHMSTSALEAISSGRVLPLEENPAIRRLRTGTPAAEQKQLLELLVDKQRAGRWRDAAAAARQTARGGLRELHPGRNGRSARRASDGRVGPRLSIPTKLRLGGLLAGTVLAQVGLKVSIGLRVRKPPAPSRRVWLFAHLARGRNLVRFVRQAARYDKHVMRQCWGTLKVLAARGETSLLLYGTGPEARILHLLSRDASVRIVGAAYWDGYRVRPPGRCRLLGENALARRREPILVAGMVNIEEKIARLRTAGVNRSRIWVLQ